MSDTKRCTGPCGRELPFPESFGRQGKKPDGSTQYRSQCRECHNAYQRLSPADKARLAEFKAIMPNYRRDAGRFRCTVCNETKPVAECSHSYSAKLASGTCRGCNAGRTALWLGVNPDYLSQWHEENPDYRREYDAAYRQTPAGRAAMKTSDTRRRARKANADCDGHTRDELMALWDELGIYACVFCGAPYEEDEHFVPLSRGGPHALGNIWPSCADCNRGIGGKHDRDPYEWLSERFPGLADVLKPWIGMFPKLDG